MESVDAACVGIKAYGYIVVMPMHYLHPSAA